MKRIISVLAAAVMLITMLGGCGKKPAQDNDSEQTSNSQDENSQTIQNQEEGESSGDNKNTAKDNQSDGSNSQTAGKADSSDKTQDSGKVTSDNNTQNGDGNGNNGDGTHTGDGAPSDNYAPPVTNTDDPGDIDPDEIGHLESDGEIDTRYEGKNDNLPYIDKASTTVSDFEITADSYDEKKLTLPIMKIVTGNGKDITSKTEYTGATVSISNTLKNYSLGNTVVDIRGRGNSTWQFFDKKAYKLKFTVKTDLFGMGAAKKWVLLANALDESMMRNYLAFNLGKALGLEFTSDCQFLNLYINGQYKGVYLLCEQVQEGSNRVNINTSPVGQVDTGYLLEGINNASPVDYKTFKLNDVNGKSLGKGAFTFIIKSPDIIQCTEEQKNFISDYVAKANEAIFNKDWDGIQKYIDVDSFVNMFLLDEILLNQDMGYSFYLYKKQGGKLFMGPAWDFDQACGSSSHGGSGYKGWYAGSELQWFTTLIEMPQFKELVSKRYQEKKTAIRGMLNTIDSTVNKYSFDFAMSNYVFNTFGDPNRWRTMYEIASCKTYKDHIIYLKTWLTNRFIWMENQLGVK
ncbi:MAG: CotH kinase family protein [Clostridia bacterium]|nr:CotH kinase family protein [Clostridia bacterium]